MSNVLTLRGIARQYKTEAASLDVLKNASLSIDKGELVALIGQSGSGKTTLLQIAGLLDTPQAGEVHISGADVTKARDDLRTYLRNKHIGFIYQFHNLLSELTALENAALPQLLAAVSHSEAIKRATALLTRLGLQDRLHHLPSQLSGGEQQRVAVARAFANKPELILADEPTGNLDPATSESVLGLFLEVAKEEGTAALIATHNIALAKRLSRAVTIKNGAIETAAL